MIQPLSIKICTDWRMAAVVTAVACTVALDAGAKDMQPGEAPAISAHGATLPRLPIVDRLKTLHASLKITPAQEPKWKIVAEVRRENAKANGALIEERAAKAGTMTAIDDLRACAGIAEAHVAGVKKLIPAVEARSDHALRSSQRDKKQVGRRSYRFVGNPRHGGRQDRVRALLPAEATLLADAAPSGMELRTFAER